MATVFKIEDGNSSLIYGLLVGPNYHVNCSDDLSCIMSTLYAKTLFNGGISVT